MPSLDIPTRSEAVQDAYRWLIPNPNLPNHLHVISSMFHAVADELLGVIDDNPQLVLALRSLTQAKDYAVRAAMS